MNEALLRNLTLRERVALGIDTPADLLEQVTQQMAERDGWVSPEDNKDREEELEGVRARLEVARQTLGAIITRLKDMDDVLGDELDELVDDLDDLDTMLWEI